MMRWRYKFQSLKSLRSRASARTPMRALWQSAVLAGSYWGACAGVFAWEAWWLRVPPAQREWNAYAPAVRARILRAVVWNQLVVNTAWLAFVNAALMPWCRARHPLTAATTPLPAWAAAPLYVLGVDVCYYALHWLGVCARFARARAHALTLAPSHSAPTRIVHARAQATPRDHRRLCARRHVLQCGRDVRPQPAQRHASPAGAQLGRRRTHAYCGCNV